MLGETLETFRNKQKLCMEEDCLFSKVSGCCGSKWLVQCAIGGEEGSSFHSQQTLPLLLIPSLLKDISAEGA